MPRDNERVRINQEIRVPEVRVVGSEGENLGVMNTRDAITKAMQAGLDLIEISPRARPPVAKITDYGKYSYEAKKKAKEMKSKQVKTETKVVQVKIGTGDNDLKRKAGKAALWIKNGHRVKVDLFLWGRYKYMDFKFLKERLEKFLAIIPESFKIADIIKKSPKGLTTVIELDKTGKGVTFNFSSDKTIEK